MEISQNWGYLIWGYLIGVSQYKDYSILGSILGFPYLGKLISRGTGKEHGSYYSGIGCKVLVARSTTGAVGLRMGAGPHSVHLGKDNSYNVVTYN